MSDQEAVDLEQQASEVIVTALVTRPPKDIILSEDDAQPWRAYMQDQAACRKRIEDAFKPIKDAAYARHKAICAKEKEKIADFVTGEMEAKGKLTDFVLAENKRRQEEQERLDAEARKKAIADAKKDGDKALANAIKNGVVPVVSEQVVQQPVKIDGFSVRSQKVGTVSDKLALIKAVAQGRVHHAVLDVNTVELNKLVRATAGTLAIPGVIISDSNVGTRR